MRLPGPIALVIAHMHIGHRVDRGAQASQDCQQLGRSRDARIMGPMIRRRGAHPRMDRRMDPNHRERDACSPRP